ncbi:MAG: hypothetical protein K2W96_05580, partial [Gemmataceae bacterium]|nr:hypothetical protein [Gemmataceae bacterium]
GGNRIPKISERKATSVEELRAAGIGVDRVLVLHDGSQAHSDLFNSILTMLDPGVMLGLASAGPPTGLAETDRERAERIERGLRVHELAKGDGPEIVELAKREQYDMVVMLLPPESPRDPLGSLDERARHVVQHVHGRVMLVTAPVIPQEVVDTTPSARP